MEQESNKRNAISAQKKQSILTDVKNGETVVSTAKKYGVSAQTVYAWKKQKHTTHQDDKQIYKENEHLRRMLGEILLKNALDN